MAYPTASRCNRCGARLASDNDDRRCAPCHVAERDRLVRAPDLPAEFWDDEALQEALTARHMGRVVRAYRTHRYHGRHALAQDVVARWVGITQAQLSRIENGPSIVHLDRLTQWARVLGIPGRYLWFKLPEDGSITSETEDVRRRGFLASTGTELWGALAPQAAGAAGPPSVEPPLTQVITDLAAAMLTPPEGDSEPATISDLTQQVTTAWRLRQRARYEALGQLLPVLIDRARASANVLEEADQEQASRVVVHTYNAASSLLKKLGDGPLALVAADRAVRAAQVVGDPVLIAAAMYRMANVLLATRRAGETGTVALQAAGRRQDCASWPHASGSPGRLGAK